MRINLFSEDIFHPDHFRQIKSIAATESEIFSEIALLSGLDPSHDFQFANLAGIDFKNSDLRGFDFTGSDLRGATGVEVFWDDSTILTGADVGGSFLAYEVSKRKLLADEVWGGEYKRRTKDYWTKNLEWFFRRLTPSNKEREAALELAKAVCDGTRDTFLRSQLLIFMAPAFKTSTAHRDYLIHNLARHSTEPMTIRVTLQALAALYANDRIAFNLMTQFIDHTDKFARDAAMAGILQSKFFKSTHDQIAKMILNFGITIRQSYLKRAGAAYGARANSIHDSFGTPYDPAETITKNMIERAAFMQMRMEDMREAEGRKVAGGKIHISDPNRDRVAERAAHIETDLQRLAALGVPLRLDLRQPVRRSAGRDVR